MSKKVIEQTKPVPKIEIFDGNDDVNVIPVTHIRQKWPHRDSTDAIQVDDSTRTTVAKAIDPEYQKVIDENKILKDQVESIFKNANDKVESLEQRNAKLVEALRIKEETINFMNKALQNTKNIEG